MASRRHEIYDRDSQFIRIARPVRLNRTQIGAWKSDFDRNSTGTGTGSLVNLRFSLPGHVQFWLYEISEPELWIAEPQYPRR
jgi:hypothetical protein